MRIIATILAAAFLGCTAPRYAKMGDITFVNPRQTQPLEMHKGAWEDVRECLQTRGARLGEEFPSDVIWFVADSIRDETRGVYVYGVTIPISGDRPWLVVIEEEEWPFAHTVSHEAVHILGRVGNDHPGWAFSCQFPAKKPLPLRIIRPRARSTA